MAQTDNTQTIGEFPVVPSANELFDTIMGKIEPELTTTIYPTLPDIYKNETPEQKADREARYRKAFVAFDAQFDAYMVDLQARMSQLQQKARRALEALDNETRGENLGQLESLIASA